MVYSPLSKKQSFYNGHKVAIGAIAKHPYLPIIATGDIQKNPDIHVWNSVSTECLAILKTSHEEGVRHLTFSLDG